MNARPKPKPLHRSLTLWSGILVLGFLAWAWWDSMLYRYEACSTHFTVASEASMVSIMRHNSPRTPGMLREKHGLGDPVIRKSTTGMDVTMHVFPPPVWVRRSSKDPRNVYTVPFEKREFSPDCRLGDAYHQRMATITRGSPRMVWRLMIPYWLILPPAIIFWCGLLLLRARRLRLAGTLADPGGQPLA